MTGTDIRDVPIVCELIATSGPMLRWLRSKRPDHVVCEDVLDPERCLMATFLMEQGIWANIGGRRFWLYSNRTSDIMLPDWFIVLTHGLFETNTSVFLASEILAILSNIKTDREIEHAV